MPRSPVPSNDSSVPSADRRRIVAVARERFFTHGLRRITMDDLAEALGMSKKTLYANFSSKTELTEAVVLDKFREVEADLQRITSVDSSDILSTLHQLVATLQRHLDELQPPYWRDIQRDAPNLFHLVESRRQELIQQHFGKLLIEGQRSGRIRKDVPAKLIIEILLGAVHSVVNPVKLQALQISPKEGLSAILKVIFEGVVRKEESKK